MPNRRNKPGSSGTGPPGGVRWVDAFRIESVGALLPLVGETLQMAAKALDREPRGNLPTDLSVLRAGLIGYEQRWQREIEDGFRDWPRAAAPQPSGLTLLSHDELTSQLIGEPTIEALERRFQDALDHLSSRLHTLSAELGQSTRPSNPVAPRQLVDALLRTLPASECEPELRALLLLQFERVCTVRLGEFYARANVQLAESGYALQSGGPTAFPPMSAHDALDAQHEQASAGWRSRARQRASEGAGDSPRARALRAWAHARGGARGLGEGARQLQDGEFLAVLSLVQADPDAWPDPGAPDIPAQVHAQIVRGAASLGIDPATASLASEQADAGLLAGAMVEGLLARHAFDADAAQLLARMAYPLCHQVMIAPGLLDDAEHPARRLLDELCWALDANPADAPEDAALRDAALRAATDVLSDLHEPERAFGQALAGLQAHLEPMRARARLMRRRLVQSVQGRERLVAARAAADALLAQVLRGQRLLPQVHAFLSTQWHHAAMQAWLRHGGDSAPFAQLVITARQLVALDASAARAEGQSVARALLGLEPMLREVLLANGLGEGSADESLAVLVRALADPDAARDDQAAEPAGLPDGEEQAGVQAAGEVDDWLTLDRGGRARRLQIAWRREDSDCCLLLNRAGQRGSDTDLVDLGPLQSAGRLQRHGAAGPVEDLLAGWQAEAASA